MVNYYNKLGSNTDSEYHVSNTELVIYDYELGSNTDMSGILI